MTRAVALIVVIAAGLWLIVVAFLMALRPRYCLDVFEKMSANLKRSNWRLQFTEQGLRVLAGVALIVRAPVSKLPLVFEVAGWILVATSLLVMVAPIRWHGAYGLWWVKRLTPVVIRILCLVPAAAGAALIYAALPVPAYGQTLDNVRQRLTRLTTTDSVPSIAVAVARDGAIVWEEGFGWADKERRVRATPHTSYAIASVTKTMTATEILILRDARRLELDRPANAYLSSFPDSVRVTSPVWNVADVTVHRLANHTAGLPTHYLFCFTGTPNCEVSIPQAIARYAIAIRLPGERFDYSNLGYGVLGVIVEGVTGRSLNEALSRDVFQPLGMHDSFIGLAPGRSGVAAASYANGGARADGYHSTTPAASDGYASVHDLARFGLFHLHTHLANELPDTVIDWMQTDTIPAVEGYQYGFGWWVDPTHFTKREVYAAGGTSVASALLLLVPTEHLAVAVATNTGFPLNDIARDIVAAYVPGFEARHVPSSSRTVRPVASLVGSWMGDIVTYRGRVPYAVRIDSLGHVHATVGRGPEADMGNLEFSADGRVEGTFSGSLPVDEYRGRAYHLETELAVHGLRLTGYVTALLEPGAVEGIGLTYWADLHRLPARGGR